MIFRKRFISVMLLLFVVVLPIVLFAAENPEPTIAGNAEAIKTTKLAIDTVWVLLAGVLVMFMQAGFAMVEAGFNQAKNAGNILMKNLVDFCVGSIAFWIVGFGLMFGAGNGFVGLSGFFLKATSDATFASLSWSPVGLQLKYFFQLVFCATAATIVSGAMAGRTKYSSYIIYSLVISAVIYPVIGHWIWGGGWLGNLGMLDFAGSTVVHSTGAWLGLTGAIVLGPRIGKYTNGKSNAIPGHNILLAGLGVFILWFGWFGFNPGSTMEAIPSISHIAVTTNIAAAAGALSAMFTAWKLFGKADVSMSLNGVLAGLVAITAPCAFVGIGSALLIGLVAGVLVVFAVIFIDRVLKIDDPVGAVAVHGVCGTWGTLSIGLFATEGGLFFGGGAKLLGIQALGVVSVFAWCMVTGFALFYAIKAFNGLRVSREEELRGLDIEEHGMESYDGFQIFTLQ